MKSKKKKIKKLSRFFKMLTKKFIFLNFDQKIFLKNSWIPKILIEFSKFFSVLKNFLKNYFQNKFSEFFYFLKK